MTDRGKSTLLSSWRRSAPCLFPVGLCLTVNICLFIAIADSRPAYLADFRLNENPDAKHYVLLGRNVWLHGEYSRSGIPPRRPDMLRTPVYPVVAGALELMHGPDAIYLAQLLMHAASCALLFTMTRRAGGNVAGFVAATLLATDLLFAASNFEAMSEPTCSILVLAAVLTCIRDDARSVLLFGCARASLVAGILLGAAILTRPAILYLPPLLAGTMVASKGFGSTLRRRASAALVMLCICYVPVVGWAVRNYYVFSVARLSNVDIGNVIYFVGAGAYQVERGITLEEAQAAISHEFDIAPYQEIQNDFASSRSVAEMDAELQDVKWRVLTRYPGSLTLSSCIGVGKSLISHKIPTLARLLGADWKAPRLTNLVHMPGRAIDLLLGNDYWLVVAFVWEMIHIVVTLLLGLVGVVFSLRYRRGRADYMLPLVAAAYFLVMIAPFGIEADSRCRFMMMPYWDFFAGCAVAWLARVKKPESVESEGSDSSVADDVVGREACA